MRAQKSNQNALLEADNIFIYPDTVIKHAGNPLFSFDFNKGILELKLSTTGHFQKHFRDNLRVNALFIATGQIPGTDFLPPHFTSSNGYLKRKITEGEKPYNSPDQPIRIQKINDTAFSAAQAAEGVKSAAALRESLSQAGASLSATIIGHSAGAYTAALYAARDGFQVTLIDPDSSECDRAFWPEQLWVQSSSIRKKMVEQPINNKVTIINTRSCPDYRKEDSLWKVYLEDRPLSSHGLIVEDEQLSPHATDETHSTAEGIFIAGDAVEGATRQAITAAASGILASQAAIHWLENHPEQ